MEVVRRPMRYAHADGHTDVCFTDDGKYILTCGIDGDLRVWCGLEDDDPTSHCIGETIYAVASKDNRVFVASENNNVHTYLFPEIEKDGIFCGFSGPITHIVPSNDGKTIVCGSRDMTIQVCDISSRKIETLLGHAAPVLGVSVDPRMKYVASSSCDGTIRIWSLDSLKCVHIWSCLPACNSFTKAKCLGRTSWFPVSGKYIAIPETSSIDLYQRESWNKIKSFKDENIKQPFSITMFSPCGEYLAASTITGEICIWNVSPTSRLSYSEHPMNYTITAMAWNPLNDGTIVLCDAMGQFGTIQGCCVTKKGMEEPFADDLLNNKLTKNEEDNENVILLEKIKVTLLEPVGKSDETEIEPTDDNGDDDDNDHDDDNDSKSSALPFHEVQPPFQPSSSPIHLQHRYMVWNSVGIIRCFNTEEENYIDVEFHDSSLHHTIHMKNLLKHSLASLSEIALLLACEIQPLTPSKIVCVLLNSWDGTREWSVELPEGEEVLSIACATDWLAAVTNLRNLRFFSIAGVQREILCLPGPVVCLAAHQSMLLVILQHGTGLNYALLHVQNKFIDTLVQFQPMPLTPQASLQWAGFSDEGTPCTVDSVGLIRILSPKGYWLPICDSQKQCKGKSDRYFVIGVSEKYENIRCILCKGSHYPPTTPRPTVVEIPMRIPLCDISSEKSILEGEFWKTQILLSSLNERKSSNLSYVVEKKEAEKCLIKTVIKLFALSCRNGLEQRALDLCKMMTTESVQLALKYATKLGKLQLAERISQICEESIIETTQLTKRSSPPSKFSSHVNEVKINGDEDKTDSSAVFHESDNKNLILLASKGKKDHPISILSPVSQRRVNNPFRKRSQPLEISGNGDSNGKKDALTTNSGSEEYITNSNGNRMHFKTPVSSIIGKVKQTGLWGKSPIIDKSINEANNTPTFVEWYSLHRESLQKEFPELHIDSLPYVALKRFKNLNPKGSDSKSNENSQTSIANNVCNIQNSQLESSQNSALAYSESSMSDIFSEHFVSNSNDSKILPESNKRKLNEDDVLEIASSSKLAKFAFKK